jgi:hypothetical protein
MPHPRAIVAPVEGIVTPPVEWGGNSCRWVYFANGAKAWLDTAEPRGAQFATVLRHVQGRPVALFADVAEGGAMQRLLVPLITRVLEVTEGAGGIDVLLETSQARHRLSAGNPHYSELRDELIRARDCKQLISLTETDEHLEIVDVRAADLRITPLPRLPKIRTAVAPAGAPSKAMPALVSVSQQRADDLFAAMTSETCEVGFIGGDCIPFLYPEDGCHARAHRMCEVLLRFFGVTAGKIWSFGSGYPHAATLVVETSNSPVCKVFWFYHSAPVIQVDIGGHAELRVFDPSLFTTHVSPTTWQSLHGDPNATLEFTSADVWDQPRNGPVIFDTDFSKTPEQLIDLQSRLVTRIVDRGKAPPYDCA